VSIPPLPAGAPGDGAFFAVAAVALNNSAAPVAAARNADLPIKYLSTMTRLPVRLSI